jgi:hypothetical protein
MSVQTSVYHAHVRGSLRCTPFRSVNSVERYVTRHFPTRLRVISDASEPIINGAEFCSPTSSRMRLFAATPESFKLGLCAAALITSTYRRQGCSMPIFRPPILRPPNPDNVGKREGFFVSNGLCICIWRRGLVNNGAIGHCSFAYLWQHLPNRKVQHAQWAPEVVHNEVNIPSEAYHSQKSQLSLFFPKAVQTHLVHEGRTLLYI